jgi:Raf kinase inhibitor-like YbhB/YbcL family protein
MPQDDDDPVPGDDEPAGGADDDVAATQARDVDELDDTVLDPHEDLDDLIARGTDEQLDETVVNDPDYEGERLELLSPAFDDGDFLPDRFAHDKRNLSPPLEWAYPPPGTVEMALLCRDPDAPRGTFTHWVLSALDPTVLTLDEGAVPVGVIEGVNDFGETGWSGPQPPRGDGPHRYVFTLFAASGWLELGPGSTADDLLEALDGRELARGELVGLYER